MSGWTRREFLKSGAAAAAGAVLAGSAGSAELHDTLSSRRPNIILILTDDQGYGDLGRHGNPILRTPHLDQFYDQSVRFTDFHVSPTCAPTRSAILTGRHEFANGVSHTIDERERMTLKATTIVELLKSAGYTTGIFGKWHLGDERAYWPDKRGFDEFFIHGAGGIGQSYPGTCGDAPGNKYFNPVVLHNGTFEKTEGYCTDVFFNQAGRWIESVKGLAPSLALPQRPFFVCITPNAPHAPLVCPEDYEKLYADKVPADVARFFGMIANIDDNVGRLVAKLKEWGIERDTLVIFMNDNGGTAGTSIYNAGMRAQKGTVYNGGARAMSLWRWPGTLRPGDVDKLTAHLDYFPTFAALAGVKVPEAVGGRLEGYSLLPLLGEGSVEWPDRVLFTHVGRWARGLAESHKYAGCGVRWGRYNMVRNQRCCQVKGCSCAGRKPDAVWELYDLEADPGEKKDIAKEQPRIVARLSAAYDRWWAEVLPCLDNEEAWKTAPKINPMQELYWKQFRGPGPNNVAPPADFVL